MVNTLESKYDINDDNKICMETSDILIEYKNKLTKKNENKGN